MKIKIILSSILCIFINSLFLKPMNNKPLIIFDFDGTLIDSVSYAFNSMKEYVNTYGFKKSDGSEMTDDDLEQLRKRGAKEIITNDLKMGYWHIAWCCRKIRNDLNNNKNKLKLINGMAETLNTLKNNGFRLVVVSSNSEENIKYVLKKENILHLFDEISNSSIFDVFNKANIVTRILKRLSIDPKDVIYVGDETRDLEMGASPDLKLKVICGGWKEAYNTPETLDEAAKNLGYEKDKTYFLANSPAELTTILLNNFK